MILRKKKLEIVLSKLDTIPSPSLRLEQYTIPPKLAAELLYIAGFIYQDIPNKNVADLGTGSGLLAIGAGLIGANYVVGVDIDSTAIKVARQNAKKLSVDVEWVVADVEAIKGPFDTIIMNPPFGTKRRHMDRVFLLKAMRTARVVYSLHKQTTRRFLRHFIELNRGLVDAIFPMELEIPYVFPFHTRKKYTVNVDLYRILTNHGR
ncbi:50S ribosomal protein L11 methyltransferase [Candidatus Bathyarchaeota archaeon]|nr:50S ribosomal protein L11 methyltransferase [Candidatus Bathyarchaeota archaeon]